MRSYSYYLHAERTEATWEQRFPSWAAGYDQWVAQPPLDDWIGPTIYDWFPELEQPSPAPERGRCPCLFVSHRRCDKEMALRIAWLARDEGWDYWIDLLDPQLHALERKLGRSQLTPEQATVATAAVIEFALLNCSHLLAVMTPHTQGSMWVPYEYGRVKEPAPFTTQVACWAHPKLAASSCPEYLVLGKVHVSESNIRQWLRCELARWQVSAGSCKDGAGAPWSESEPERLPGEQDRMGQKSAGAVDYQGSARDPNIEFDPGEVRVGDFTVPRDE